MDCTPSSWVTSRLWYLDTHGFTVEAALVVASAVVATAVFIGAGLPLGHDGSPRRSLIVYRLLIVRIGWE
jgi:hypothetical protein